MRSRSGLILGGALGNLTDRVVRGARAARARDGLHRLARLAGVQRGRQRDRGGRGPARVVARSVRDGARADRGRRARRCAEALDGGARPARRRASRELTGAAAGRRPARDRRRRGSSSTASARPKSFRLAGGERHRGRPGTDARARSRRARRCPSATDDAHLLVVAKPAGLVTHPTERRRGGHAREPPARDGGAAVAAGRPAAPGDRAPAGRGHERADGGGEDRRGARARSPRCSGGTTVERRYLALVRGAVGARRLRASTRRSGRRARPGRRRPHRGARGRDGVRGARSVRRARRCSRRRPRTGRTHQIRVHLPAIGHPILGDRAYGGGGRRGRRARPRSARSCTRGGSRFDHPVTGERIELEEPLPGPGGARPEPRSSGSAPALATCDLDDPRGRA